MKNRTTSQDQRVRQASANRRERERLDLRERILLAAREVFLEQGYESFSMRQIAERIGYSATTIYLHFADRDELLFALVLDGFKRFGAELETAARNAHDPLERLEAIGRAYVRFGLEHPADYRVMFMQRGDFLLKSPAGSDQPLIDSFGVLEGAVRAATEAGRIETADPKVFADVLWAATHGLVSLAIGTPLFSREELEACLPVLFATVQRGVSVK
jgi:AcrR family transcriptional regulator